MIGQASDTASSYLQAWWSDGETATGTVDKNRALIIPWKINMEPQKWRFKEDDFTFQLGDFEFPC